MTGEFDFAECRFELLANSAGFAAERTIMQFTSARSPWTAMYSGPNTVVGQVLLEMVEGVSQMLYQAVSVDGQLQAGAAVVTVREGESGCVMRLDWRWLNASGAGVSEWREVSRHSGSST